MPDVLQLKHEFDQLLTHWRSIDLAYLEKYAAKVAGQFIGGAANRDKGHYIRQYHNVLGYRAGMGLSEGGLCAGCLYRTEAFIKLPQDLRTGKKQHPAHLTKVHVEHTIPVAVLSSAIDRMGPALWNAKAAGEYLLANSIATAMLEPEGQMPKGDERPDALVLSGYSQKTGAFVEGHQHFGRPFMRYTARASRPRIFNVLTSVEIDVETFTMTDFRNDLQLLLQAADIDIQLAR